MVSFPGLNQETAMLQERVERFHAVRQEIMGQVREVIVASRK